MSMRYNTNGARSPRSKVILDSLLEGLTTFTPQTITCQPVPVAVLLSRAIGNKPLQGETVVKAVVVAAVEAAAMLDGAHLPVGR